jgi:hypothetical protein
MWRCCGYENAPSDLGTRSRSHITTDSQSASLGVKRPSGTRDQFFFLLEISFRQLRVCYFVVPSLTRGRVCNLLCNCFWALPEQLLLSLAELTAIFYCLIWDSPNLEGHVPVFISPSNRVAQLCPRALGSHFIASYDSQGSGGGILSLLHTGVSPWDTCDSDIGREEARVSLLLCRAAVAKFRPRNLWAGGNSNNMGFSMLHKLQRSTIAKSGTMGYDLNVKRELCLLSIRPFAWHCVPYY